MLSVEKALGIYTDELNANKTIDLNCFKEQLTVEDYEEFLDLIQFVKLAKSVKVTDDFNKTFAKLKKRKNEVYSEQPLKASGFRTQNGTQDKDANDILDKIFKEEFGDGE